MKIIANRSVTMSLLDQYQVKVRKNYGQNFIIDPSIVSKIAQNCGATKTTTVLEIGPGLGSLTQQLALVAKEVISYEIDPQMVEVSSHELADLNVRIIHQDFMEADLSEIKADDLVVCSNVPYYITTPIIFKCLESQLPVKQLTLMVQKEMAQRLNAHVNSKHYNALSVIMELFFERKTLMQVPADCFYPKPNVDSTVIQLIRNQNDVLAKQDFIVFVKKCFTQRRKTLVNNLKQDYPMIEEVLRQCAISPSIRAQELTVQQFVALYDKLSSIKL